MDKYKLNEDIFKAQDIINNNFCHTFSKLYSFTTENINGYINDFDLFNKSLLTVGSSLDQCINAILMGCSDVTVMDINPFVKYYFYLKKAAILTLNYEDYYNFFQDYESNFNLFLEKLYQIIMKKLFVLNTESFFFWDTLHKSYELKTIRYNLFNNKIKEQNCIKKFNTYLNSDLNYKITKTKISNVNPKFIIDNILNIDKYTHINRYDNIFLSNIFDYQKERINDFKYSLQYLKHMLNCDGKLMVAYLYGINDTNSLIDFSNSKVINDYNIKIISGVRGIYLNNNIKDGVAIYQKKR